MHIYPVPQPETFRKETNYEVREYELYLPVSISIAHGAGFGAGHDGRRHSHKPRNREHRYGRLVGIYLPVTSPRHLELPWPGSDKTCFCLGGSAPASTTLQPWRSRASLSCQRGMRVRDGGGGQLAARQPVAYRQLGAAQRQTAPSAYHQRCTHCQLAGLQGTGRDTGAARHELHTNYGSVCPSHPGDPPGWAARTSRAESELQCNARRRACRVASWLSWIQNEPSLTHELDEYLYSPRGVDTGLRFVRSRTDRIRPAGARESGPGMPTGPPIGAEGPAVSHAADGSPVRAGSGIRGGFKAGVYLFLPPRN